MDSQNTAATTSTTTEDVEMSQSQISDTQREPTLGSDAEDDDEQGRRVLAGRARLGSFWEVDGWNDGESEPHASMRLNVDLAADLMIFGVIDYLRELEDVARKGFMPDSDWTALHHMLKLRIKQNIGDLLLLPSNAPLASSSSSPSKSNTTSQQHPLNRGDGSADSFAMESELPNLLDRARQDARSSLKGDLDESTASYTPSTPGGLVLPPFPPLVRNRDRQKLAQDRPGSAGGYMSSGTGGLDYLLGSKQGQGVQGYTHQTIQNQPLSSSQQQGQSGMAGSDPLFDEEAAIGGKILPGRLRPREAEGLLESVWRLLDEFEAEPPFTVQRLCELAAFPDRQHRLPGKYVRALERVLLVTSTFDPSASTLSAGGADTIAPGSGVPGVPPALLLERPLFVLIDPSEAGAHGSGEAGFDMAASMRTDRPPMNVEVGPSSGTGMDMTDSSAGLGGPPVDPTPEPFLGRVDELDAGPLVGPASSSASSSSALGTMADPSTSTNPGSAEDPHRLRGEGGDGVGMVVQHGLSERPRAISSTTDLSALSGGGGHPGEDDGGYRDTKKSITDESESEVEAGSETGSEGDDSGYAQSSEILTGPSWVPGTPYIEGMTVKARNRRGRPDQNRPMKQLPRTVSTQSLTDRFASAGVEVMDPAKEERARLGGIPGEGAGAIVHAGEGRVGVAGGPDEGHGIKVEAGQVKGEQTTSDDKQEKDADEAKKEDDGEVSAPTPSKVRKVEG